MIDDGKQVTVLYKGYLDDGEVFDSSEMHDNEPFSFIVGAGNVIAGFDTAVRDMKIGDKKTIRVEPADAYGEYKMELLQSEKIENIPDGEELAKRVGQSVGFQNEGEYFQAQVVSVENGEITVDFNHPLAGKALNFDIELRNIKDKPDPDVLAMTYGEQA